MEKPRNTDRGRLLRLSDVLERVPISRSAWWEGVKARKYPQPVKLGLRITCWRERDIDDLVEHGLE